MYIIVWLTGCLAHSVSLLHEAPEGQRSPETLLLTGWWNTSSLHKGHADGFCRCIHLDSCVCIQNIDTLERVAGLEGDDLIEAHGTFYTSHCVSFCCRKEYNLDWMKGFISHSRFAQINYYCGVLISSLCLCRKNLLWWNSQMWQVWQFSETRWVGLCLSILSFTLVLLSTLFIYFTFHIHYIDISQTSLLLVCCLCMYVCMYVVIYLFIYFKSRYCLLWRESSCSVLHFNEDGEHWVVLFKCASILKMSNSSFATINSLKLFFYVPTRTFPAVIFSLLWERLCRSSHLQASLAGTAV